MEEAAVMRTPELRRTSCGLAAAARDHRSGTVELPMQKGRELHADEVRCTNMCNVTRGRWYMVGVGASLPPGLSSLVHFVSLRVRETRAVWTSAEDAGLPYPLDEGATAGAVYPVVRAGCHVRTQAVDEQRVEVRRVDTRGGDARFSAARICTLTLLHRI
ncbi:hypothetical protein K438DRAFT_2001379 [Mycena galopus ATCC 62051]|nr:hypothetical protein K438DRAFT_2001379 [Mycena galopus ATCC 62051]